MQHELNTKNIVLAGVFEVPYFDKHFFIKNEIVKEDEIVPTFTIFESAHVQLFAQKFQLFITAGQAIVSGNDEQDMVNAALALYKALPDVTIITALGINFNWNLVDGNLPLSNFSKKYFYSNQIELLSKYFNSDNSTHGLIASSDYMDGRLKFEGRAVLINKMHMQVQLKNQEQVVLDANNIKSSTTTEAISLQFNFHFEIKQKALNSMKILNEYSLYKNRAEEITHSLN